MRILPNEFGGSGIGRRLGAPGGIGIPDSSTCGVGAGEGYDSAGGLSGKDVKVSMCAPAPRLRQQRSKYWDDSHFEYHRDRKYEALYPNRLPPWLSEPGKLVVVVQGMSTNDSVVDG